MRAVAALLAIALTSGATASAQEHRPVFDGIVEAVRAHYYEPHYNGRDWAAITARYESRLAGVTTDAAFLRLGQAMLDELGTSHVVLHPPGNSGPSMGLGARWSRIGEATVITEIDPVSGAREAGLRPGDIVLDPSAIYGPPDQPARVEVERCDGTRATLTLPRESAFWPPRQRTISWSTLRRGDGRSVGYIRADRFEDDGAELIDAAMSSMAETDGLVIDLRGNSGGNASALRLLSYFADEGPALALLARSYLDTLDGPVEAADMARVHRASRPYTTEAVFAAVTEGQGATILMTEDLGDLRYRKPVVVLIGEETGSAAEGFAWGVRLMTEATLVGRDSAGALLSSERFDLPQGWAVTLPVHGIWGPDGQDYGDRSVPPHVAVPLSREAICAGADLDLERGVTVLEERWARLSRAM